MDVLHAGSKFQNAGSLIFVFSKGDQSLAS